jgi:hypothetical protein
MILSIVSWFESHMQPCPYKQQLGVDCPGCGMQRSILELLKGNIVDSFLAYPAMFPLIFLVIFLFLHLKFKFTNGANIIKYLFIFVVIIVVINFVVKLFIKH